MKVDQIYQKRFNDYELRNDLWDVLVKDYFQKFVGKNDVVLDVPCGYAEFINKIKCKKKYAVDINPDSKKYVSKDVTFYKSSSSDMPIKKDSIDKIFISNFFEHLTHEQIEDTIVELRRVLKKGGKVMVLQPNIRFAAKDYWMFFDHITPIDDRALEEVFALHDLKITKRVLRFMPFTSQSSLPVKKIFIKAYLKLPIVWRIMGQQSFLIFEK